MKWSEVCFNNPQKGRPVVLVGEYDLSLDEKGRLSVPAGLRHILNELYGPEDGNLLFITKYFENCLVVYPKPVWVDIQEQVNELPNDAKIPLFHTQFLLQRLHVEPRPARAHADSAEIAAVRRHRLRGSHGRSWEGKSNCGPRPAGRLTKQISRPILSPTNELPLSSCEARP